MKTIDAIIIHCSATRAGQDLRAKDIDRMHRARGFNQIGYNFIKSNTIYAVCVPP